MNTGKAVAMTKFFFFFAASASAFCGGNPLPSVQKSLSLPLSISPPQRSLRQEDLEREIQSHLVTRQLKLDMDRLDIRSLFEKSEKRRKLQPDVDDSSTADISSGFDDKTAALFSNSNRKRDLKNKTKRPPQRKATSRALLKASNEEKSKVYNMKQTSC